MNIYESWLVKKPIAHRGLHDENAEENSPAAFENAIKAGYAIETDLQMTSDGVVVVFHDDDLSRMTGLRGNIQEIDYEYVRYAPLGKSKERMPTFDEFLSLVRGRTPVLIEIKTHKNIGVMEQKILQSLKRYSGEFALQSFNPYIVEWFAKNAPQYVRGQLASDFEDSDLPRYQKYLLKNLAFIRRNKSQFVSYDINGIQKGLIKRVKRRMPVLMWTVRSQEQIDSLKGYHDNIIFENFIPKTK